VKPNAPHDRAQRLSLESCAKLVYGAPTMRELTDLLLDTYQGDEDRAYSAAVNVRSRLKRAGLAAPTVARKCFLVIDWKAKLERKDFRKRKKEVQVRL
jgi:hypothetical protein